MRMYEILLRDHEPGRCFISSFVSCWGGLSCWSRMQPSRWDSHTGQGGLVPLASGRIGGSFLLDDAVISASDAVELLLVTEEVSVSSGMVANFFRTCLRAGRRMGLLLDS